MKLNQTQLEAKMNFIKNYKRKGNPATASKIDPNANIVNKNLTTLETELYKAENVQVNRALVGEKITEMFGPEMEIEYNRQIEDREIYIHDETSLKPYCVSLNMFPILTGGMTVLDGESKIPKNIKSFSGVFINMLFAISSYFAGAVATVEFLLYFDHFARKEYGEGYMNNLTPSLYKELSQYFQQIVYSINQPAMARSYQCVREDTTQLSTPEGFKYLSELKEGDECYVWKDGKIKIEKIKKLNVDKFDGELLQFKGRNYQQTVTSNHRVLYKKPNTQEYDIKEAHELFGHSKLSLPIASEGIDREDYPISDDLLQLCVATLTEGTISKNGQITIYKSKNRWGYTEIPKLLDDNGINYKISNCTSSCFGEVVNIDIDKLNSQIILRVLKHTKKTIPFLFKQLSVRQARLFLNTWSKLDGTTIGGKFIAKLQCDNDDIRNDLQEIAILAGYGSQIYDREMEKFDGSNKCIVKYLKIFKRKDKRISEYNKIQYNGNVWCPTTDAGVVIFREENGIPYISGNSIFWNISIFDENYFNSLFGTFVFPDGDTPSWDSLNGLQKVFMKWLNEERTKAVLTFPVVTVAMLVDDKAPVDEEFEEFIAEEMSEGNAFFVYQSKSVDSLASCCFDGKQKCLTKSSDGINYMSFKELSESKYNDTKKNFTIFHNGSWVKGKEVKLPANRDMYKIITSNKKEFIISDNHINVCIDGEKQTKDLKVGDKLLFNTNKLDTFPEKDLGLTYNQGFSVGAFLGDGSFGTRTKYGIFEINYSLGKKEVHKIKSIIDTLGRIGNIGGVINSVYPLRYSNKELVEFIQYWINWEEGTLANNKKLNLNCLLQSVEFRQGILDGWYETDGGNSNRCYTTSPELAENMEVLITSLGMNTIIDISDRIDEKVIIREKEYNRNYPLYCVRWYNTKNKRSMGDIYTYKNNSIYFNINSIEKIEYNENNIFCFEMDNKDEEYFTLPNGLITHNCRLRNELSDNTFSYSLGAGGVSTGSINVITINMNRLIQDKRDLAGEIDKIHCYQLAYRETIKDWISAGFLAPYTSGFITLDKQFLTIGINGMAEGAESLGITVGNNQEYKDWVSSQLKIIYDKNKEIKTKTGVMFNTEFVPAEGLGVKNSQWDKEDGYIVNRDAYNSYFYIVEDEKTTMLDKFILHGKDMIKYLDGGSALHLNLEEYLTKENAINLLRISAKTGCNYFCTNIKITICNDCEFINKETKQICTKCGSTNIDYATRIIGYLKRISNFSKDRQEEAGRRFYHLEK